MHAILDYDSTGSRMFTKRSPTALRLCLTLLLLQTAVLKGEAAGPTPISFTHEGGAYIAHLTPATYVDAVTACGNSSLLPGPGTLLHVEHIAHLLVELSVTQPDVAQHLVEGIAAVTATNPSDQEWWDVWVLDRHRPCRGATYIFEAENYFMTTDVPCEWRLCFVCAEESVALAQGYTVSRPWLAQHSAAAAQPSAYRLGPAGSGLRLVQSDLALGMAVAPVTNASSFDESGAFWSSGPVYSALFRGGTHSLFSLRPLHEDDGMDGWRMVRNQSLITPQMYWGTTLGSWMEYFNTPAGGHDYVVALEGCYQKGLQVERLILFTRTGRRFHMGRGSCDTRFREEAPAEGAYLAGWSGWAINSNVWPALPPPYDFDIGFIYQMRALWAIPTGAVVSQRFWTQPTSAPVTGANGSATPAGSTSSTASGLTVCPAALQQAASRFSQFPAECGPSTGGLCPSNTCCGDRSIQPSQNRVLTTCGVAGRTTCQTNCIPGYGLCGVAPEAAGMLFVRSALAEELLPPPPSSPAAAAGGTASFQRQVGVAALAPPAAATTLYMLLPTQQMTYSAAQAYCRSSSFMGLSDWQLVEYRDALDWTTSMDTRRGAYQALAGLFFWVGVNDTYSAQAPEYACMRGVWALPRYNDRYSHMFYPSSCLVTSGVVCKASAAQNVSRLGLAAAAAANRSELWVPGPHSLLASRRLGTGPYGASCAFAIGATPPAAAQPLYSEAPFPPPPSVAGGEGSSSSSSSSSNSSTAIPQKPVAQLVSQALAAVELAVAAMTPNGTDYIEVVVGLQLTLQSANTSTAGNASTASRQAAGVGSSGGWHTLTLAPGEVVVAVSGCAGGFVERLVFHTSAGRLWSTPFGAMSVCSAAFLEQAPQGGYLVGMQGYYGSYMEQLQLVWGTPAVQMVPPPPVNGSSSGGHGDGEDSGSQSSSGLSAGAVAGIVVGSVVVGLVLVALLVATLVAWRRRQAQTGLKPAPGAVGSKSAGSSSGQGLVPGDVNSSGSESVKPNAAITAAAPAGVAMLGQQQQVQQVQQPQLPRPQAQTWLPPAAATAAAPSKAASPFAPAIMTPAASLMAGALLPMPLSATTESTMAAAATASASSGSAGGDSCIDGGNGAAVTAAAGSQPAACDVAEAMGAGTRAPTRSTSTGGAAFMHQQQQASGEHLRHGSHDRNGSGGGLLGSTSTTYDGSAAPAVAQAAQQPPPPQPQPRLSAILGALAAAQPGNAGAAGGGASDRLTFRISKLGTLQSDTAAGRAMDVVLAPPPPMLARPPPRMPSPHAKPDISAGAALGAHQVAATVHAAAAAQLAGGPDTQHVAAAADLQQRLSLRLGVDVVVDFKALLGRGSSGVVYRGTLLYPSAGVQPLEQQQQQQVAAHAAKLGSGSFSRSSSCGILGSTGGCGGKDGAAGGGVAVAVKLLTIFAERHASHTSSGAADGAAPAAVGEEAAGKAAAAEPDPEAGPDAAAAGDGAAAAADSYADPDVVQHLRMLQQEVAVLSRLDHPNVVRLLGACLDPPRPFLVQELMTVPLSRVVHGRGKDGGPLYPYDLVDVLRIARDVATALMYLHPTVLHRDLKPGNVMLDAGGTAKVLDFGLARFKYATQLPTTNVEVGTTAYMSPESFTPTAKITDRSDIYSWAVIVVEMATRRRPWEGTRNAIIGYLVAIERQRPQLPAEGDPLFPPGLRSLVERCMRQNPEERPSAAEIVKRLTLLLADAAADLAAAM